jgi:hypothetical protein
MSKVRSVALVTGLIVIVALQLILPALLDLVTTMLLVGGAYAAGRTTK